MIAARPLLGQGAGTFLDAYPAFHELSPSTVTWNRAHDTYLQMAAELGVPVFAIVLITVAGILFYLVRGLSQRNKPSPVAIAAVGALVAAAVHSIVDFSLQFQAVGLTLAVLVGAGLGKSATNPIAGRRAKTDDEKTTDRAASDFLAQFNVAIPVSAEARECIEPYVPAGRRLYVFGDLHGRLDLLRNLRESIRDDLRNFPIEDCLVIGLGDYIDRGPESRQVIDALSSNFFGCSAVFVRGNHEQMLADFLEDPARIGPNWFHYGAVETLRSYTAEANSLLSTAKIDYSAIRDKLARAMPPTHLLFLQRLPTSYEIGSYYFAHAGARASVPLDKQVQQDLLWIRSGFADRDDKFAKIIVHGHTPVDQPYFGEFRINLDTGAYFTNRLTCLVLEAGTRRLLSLQAAPPVSDTADLVTS